MKRIIANFVISLTLFIAVITAWMMSIRPWQSKFLAHGYSPERREYCVVQTFKGWVEPYQVCFYVRDSDGVWRWNYLKHEDNGWKTARVTFSEGSAQIDRNGVTLKEIEVPNDHVDWTAVLPGYRYQYCASEFSVDDVLAFHNQRYN